MPQITTRLSPETRRKFELYAASLGLNGSALARLLLVRKLRQPMGMGRKTDSEDGKLTAHSCDSVTVKRLQAYARAHRMSRAAAAKSIFERELTEQWLFKALSK